MARTSRATGDIAVGEPEARYASSSERPEAESPLPPEFDPALYVAHPANADLEGFSPEEALCHYQNHGLSEGRYCSAVQGRETFLSLIPDKTKILEIGPFANPCFRAGTRKIRYLDVASTEDLRRQAQEWAFDDSRVPFIDYVWRGEPYHDLIGTEFDVIVSSHCIEHQPCFLTHLENIRSVLRPHGRVFLIVPDKRFCFDHFRPESTIADVLEAFIEKRRHHTLRSVLQHRLLLTHNEAEAHWRGEHGEDPLFASLSSGIGRRVLEFVRAPPTDQIHPDIHAWQFTPTSFRRLFTELADMALSPLGIERLYSTCRPSNEFYAVLAPLSRGHACSRQGG